MIDLIEAIPFFIFLNLLHEDFDKKCCRNFAFMDNLKYSILVVKILEMYKINNNLALKRIDKFLSKIYFFSDWKALLSNVLFIICSIHLVN